MLQIVIPLHHGGGAEKTDIELRYALRGWHACLAEPHTVTLIGRRLPEWLTGVGHIPQENGDLKTAIKLAAKHFPDGFLWAYDDTIPLRPTTAAELKSPVARVPFGTNAPTSWSKQLLKIHARLVAEGIPPLDFSRPHCPYWFDAGMIEEAFADWPGMSAKFPFETWILSKRRVPYRHGLEKQYYHKFAEPPGPAHSFLTFSDQGWTPALKAWLGTRYPDPSPFEKALPAIAPPIPMKIQVHTIRIGSPDWMQVCAPTLDDWCARHGHELVIWRQSDIPKGYPHPKFCEVDMLRRFLKSDATHFFHIDADVFIDPAAPAHPHITGPGLLAMPDYPCKIVRDWPRWAKIRRPQSRLATRGWQYLNAGIWLCDRTAAAAILKRAVPPFHIGCMEQNDWNVWCAMAHRDGMPVHHLPREWNAFHYHEHTAHFYHISGKHKETKLQQRIQWGHIPASAQLTPP